MFLVLSMRPHDLLRPRGPPALPGAVPLLTLGTLTEHGTKKIKSEGFFLALDHQVSYRTTTRYPLK